VKVTRHDTGASTMTVVRQFEESTRFPVRAWSAGDSFMLALTAGVVTQTYTHPGESVGAHAATAISVTPAGGISSDTVQEALEELDSEKASAGHSHQASAIPFTASGTALDETNIQAALAALEGLVFQWLSVSGTPTAIVASTDGGLDALSAGRGFRFVPASINTGSVTLNIDSLGAKDVLRAGGLALLPGHLQTSTVHTVVYDGTQFILQNPAINPARVTVASHATTANIWVASDEIDFTGTETVTDFPDAPKAGEWRVLRCTDACTFTNNANLIVQGGVSFTAQAGDIVTVHAATVNTFSVEIPRPTTGSRIQPITASASAGALTITLNPTTLDFRSSTLTSGATNTRTVSAAISLTIPSGGTLGTTSLSGYRLAVLAIDNAGTLELAVCNAGGSVNLDESTLISTTILDTGSDSANSAYSTTARSSVPFRVVGFLEDSVNTTAGTWVDPTKIQGQGGVVESFNRIRSGTAVTASGTAVDFTGIPSWVKRITVQCADLSTTGASIVIIQIGDSGGVETSSYLGSLGKVSGSPTAANNSSGFAIEDTSGAGVSRHGAIVLTLLNSATNTWVAQGVIGRSDSSAVYVQGGSKALSATLDRVRITTAGGADTFDAGTINIMYE
jgi:hypothetical protein